MVTRTSVYGPDDSVWAVDYIPGFMQRQQAVPRGHWERLYRAGIRLAVINLHNGTKQVNARHNLFEARRAGMRIAGYLLIWNRQSSFERFAGAANSELHPTNQVDAAYDAATGGGSDASLWSDMKFVAVGLRKNLHPKNGDAHNYKQAAPGDARTAINRLEARGVDDVWIYTDRNYYEEFFLRFARAAPNSSFSFRLAQDQYEPNSSETVSQVLGTDDQLAYESEFSSRLLWDRHITDLTTVGSEPVAT